MIKIMLNKIILAALVTVFAVSTIPFTSVLAQDENPPLPGRFTNERLEWIWARQLQAYERLGRAFDGTDARIAKIQELIDKASANGRDVSNVQAALDAFEAALKDAHPTYESIKGIVNSHQGFDSAGTVTDPEKAGATVQEMRAKLQEIKSAMDGSFKALREALRAFREANKPADQPADVRGR
jgi:hypothetical protein